MGTNYYCIFTEKSRWYQDSPTMKVQHRLHIGKSSGGWTFSFHGIIEWEAEKNDIQEIKSFKDWKELFRTYRCKIEDEYGKNVSVKEFIKLVEEKKTARSNHYHYCKKEYPESMQDQWLDDEGNSFTSGEFS